MDAVGARAAANDGVFGPYSVTLLAFIGAEEGAFGERLLAAGRERAWSCRDSSLIPLHPL